MLVSLFCSKQPIMRYFDIPTIDENYNLNLHLSEMLLTYSI